MGTVKGCGDKSAEVNQRAIEAERAKDRGKGFLFALSASARKTYARRYDAEENDGSEM